MSHPSIRLFAPVLASVALAACAVGPDYHRPAVETPPAFKEAQGWTPAVPADSLDRGDWWSLFGDPILNGLEQRVEVDNQNLKAAEAAYREARALVAQDRATLFPTLDLTGSGTRSGSNGGSARGAGAGSVGTGGTGVAGTTGSQSGDTYQAALGASWEPDIWGKIRRTIEGASASAQASDADLANARLSAQSELAADYVQLRLADANRALYQRTVDAYGRALKITQNQYDAGVAARSDVLQAQTQLTGAQSSLVGVETSRTQAEHAIAVLIGVAPASFSLDADPNWAPQPPPTPQGLPSTLLQRRPDVAAAERSVAAANAQIGVQTAGYFPDLTLNGSYGFAASSLGSLFNSSNALWSYGANAAETLFNAGATTAAVRGAKAAYDQSVANYRQTVLSAFQQVEDDLAAARVLQNQQVYAAESSSDADQAETILLNQYRAGTVAYTSVVTAQTAALQAREALLTIQGQRITNSVALITALGGGWSGAMK